jgi:hypothetical protein
MSIEFIVESDEDETTDQSIYDSFLPALPKSWVSHDTPVIPSGFLGDAFVLPVHQERLLKALNPHDRDLRIVFFEGPHIYEVDGIEISCSVTTLIHKFSDKFIPEEAIAMMRKGSNWPRPEYVTVSRQIWSAFSSKAQEASKTVDSSKYTKTWKRDLKTLDEVVNRTDGEMTGDDLCTACFASSSLCKSSPIRNDIDLASVEDTNKTILQKWDDNRDEAANLGTWMHLQCELWINRDGCHTDTSEMEMFLRYVRERLVKMNIVPYRTEWEIYGEEEDLAGSIDFVGIITDGPQSGGLVLVDWKRTRELRNKNHHPMGKKMIHPFSKFVDTSKSHYSLQLNAYAYIIEKYYDKKIVHMEIACFHPDNLGKPYFIEVPRMTPEMQYLMSWQRSEARVKILSRAENNLK